MAEAATGADAGQASPPPITHTTHFLLLLPSLLVTLGSSATVEPGPPVSTASLLYLSARPSAPMPSCPSSNATSPRKTSLTTPAQLTWPRLSAQNTQSWYLSFHCPGSLHWFGGLAAPPLPPLLFLLLVGGPDTQSVLSSCTFYPQL